MGKVYILTNKWMPDAVKIGNTNRTVAERIKEISQLSAPKGWVEHFTIESEKFEDIEKLMHKIFKDKQIWPEREYFEVEKERAAMILKLVMDLCGGSIATQEDVNEEEDSQIQPRKRVLPLTAYAPEGSELVFTRDDTVKCTIIDKKRVRYNDKDYSSLSNLAGELVVEKLNYKHPNVAGTDFFMYNGKILSELRDEILSGETE